MSSVNPPATAVLREEFNTLFLGLVAIFLAFLLGWFSFGTLADSSKCALVALLVISYQLNLALVMRHEIAGTEGLLVGILAIVSGIILPFYTAFIVWEWSHNIGIVATLFLLVLVFIVFGFNLMRHLVITANGPR